MKYLVAVVAALVSINLFAELQTPYDYYVWGEKSISYSISADEEHVLNGEFTSTDKKINLEMYGVRQVLTYVDKWVTYESCTSYDYYFTPYGLTAYELDELVNGIGEKSAPRLVRDREFMRGEYYNFYQFVEALRDAEDRNSRLRGVAERVLNASDVNAANLGFTSQNYNTDYCQQVTDIVKVPTWVDQAEKIHGKTLVVTLDARFTDLILLKGQSQEVTVEFSQIEVNEEPEWVVYANGFHKVRAFNVQSSGVNSFAVDVSLKRKKVVPSVNSVEVSYRRVSDSQIEVSLRDLEVLRGNILAGKAEISLDVNVDSFWTLPPYKNLTEKTILLSEEEPEKKVLLNIDPDYDDIYLKFSIKRYGSPIYLENRRSSSKIIY